LEFLKVVEAPVLSLVIVMMAKFNGGTVDVMCGRAPCEGRTWLEPPACGP
jgi:hypothetical protein